MGWRKVDCPILGAFTNRAKYFSKKVKKVVDFLIHFCYYNKVACDWSGKAPWQINSNATLKHSKKNKFQKKVSNETKPKRSKPDERVWDRIKHYNMRVWSWLRMNAGGVLNTCKSNGVCMKPSDCRLSGGRVSNAWVTCLVLGDNSWKRLLIPHKRTASHEAVWKTPVVQDGPASD